MIIMVAGAEKRKNAHLLGDFVTPHRWRQIGTTAIWAADNAAFSNFDEDRFSAMVDNIAKCRNKPKFIALPDVVGNHDETVTRSLPWRHELRKRKLNCAFVLQNGIEKVGMDGAVAFARWMDAFFIGGTTEFKLGPWVRAFAKEIHRLNAARLGHYWWLHMGRVNSVERAHYARMIGCDSVDGSGLARFGELDRVARSLTQGLLFEEAVI